MPVSSCNPLSDTGCGGGGDSTRGRAACVLLPGAHHGDGVQTSCIHRPNLSAAPVNVSSSDSEKSDRPPIASSSRSSASASDHGIDSTESARGRPKKRTTVSWHPS
ncbi:GH23595 [Drosophila grimshawi]|uniref:GH23595 n=1 Tax=Drosophila grimshawi TaxID=7222 RepID=B4K162_DROGR|nr:GH23595 [Drosophila grimshawi]